MTDRVPRLAVFLSGSGSNLQAIIDAIRVGDLRAEIVLVVSNRREAYGLTRAQAAAIPTLYFPLKPYREQVGDAGDSTVRARYDSDLAAHTADVMPDLIVLAGWMHVLSPAFLDRFPGRVINLHPALPGSFVGAHGIEKAFEAWQRGDISESGCMVHYAIPEIDAGNVLATATVPFLPGDTVESYAERMHAAEHSLIVAGIKAHFASIR